MNQTSIITYSINAQSLTFGNSKSPNITKLYIPILWLPILITTYFLRKQQCPMSNKNNKIDAITFTRKVLLYTCRQRNPTTNPSLVGIIMDCTLNWQYSSKSGNENDDRLIWKPTRSVHDCYHWNYPRTRRQ